MFDPVRKFHETLKEIRRTPSCTTEDVMTRLELYKLLEQYRKMARHNNLQASRVEWNSRRQP